MATLFGGDDLLDNKPSDDSCERVILAGVWETSAQEYGSEEEFTHSMEELSELSKACGMEPVRTVTQRIPRRSAALYVGEGKAEELSRFVDAEEASRVICNDTLSPSQLRNLQKLLKVPVMDRTRLIIEIFERRARSREARLQVEMAKLNYLKPRLIGMWETQNRQGGASGALSSKGEGETQLEIDRRLIDRRLAALRRELKEVEKERNIQRNKRQKSSVPLVALVGYTNAGKSTIMNAMLSRWPDGSSKVNEKGKREVFEADMLFATLDTTIRKIHTGRGMDFLLSDTVGFIHSLPTALVEAFKSTLEEVTRADLILHVVDRSDPHFEEQMKVTQQTLSEIGAGHIPAITVFNKCDLADPPVNYPRVKQDKYERAAGIQNRVFISAKDTLSIDMLSKEIIRQLQSGSRLYEFLIPYSAGNVQSFLMEHARVIDTRYEADSVRILAGCSEYISQKAVKISRGVIARPAESNEPR